MRVQKRSNVSTTGRTRNSICWRQGVGALIGIVLSAGAATAQQNASPATDTVAMRGNRDLNGTIAVTEQVVTRRTQSSGGEQVVLETFSPSIEAGRLALTRRVRRMTTATADGTQTVELSEERNPAAPTEPLRVVRKSVTTVHRTDAGSFVTERQVLEPDLNGRFVLVLAQSERTSRN
jgi:hypothetical protein